MSFVSRTIASVAVGSLALVTASAQNAAPPVQTASAKGRLITTTDIRNWRSIRQNVLSPDGKWFVYSVGSTESEDTLVIRGIARGAAEKRVALGAGGGSVSISGDSKWLGYIVGPPRPANAAGRGGRAGQGGGAGAGNPGRGNGGRAGQGADSTGGGAPAQANKFVLMNLATGDTREFARIRRFSFNADNATWIAMQGYMQSATPDANAAAAAGRGGAGGRGGRGGAPDAGGPGAESGAGANLLLYKIGSPDLPFSMGEVNQYSFNEDGDWLAYTMETPDQVGNSTWLRNMNSGVALPIESEPLLYRHLSWVDSSRSLSVMRGKVMTTGTRDTVFSIELFSRIGADGKPARKMLFSSEGRTDFPAGMKLASERAPRYSADMQAVFFGIREAAKAPARGQTANAGRGGAGIQGGAPGAGGTINQTQAGRGGAAAADEDPSLILWHYKDPRLQSQQIVQEAADRAFNYLVEYRFAENKFIRLADDRIRNVTTAANDRFAYGSDNTDYQERASYTGRNYNDTYIFDLKTGEKKVLWKKRPAGGGGGGLSVSPDASKALYWGSDGNYWVLDLKTLDSVNITKTVATSFVDTEDDHNNIFPPSIASRGWTKDNKFVLLSDNWDIWKVSVAPGVPAVNLTVNGKRDQIRYRQIFEWASENAAAGGGGGRGGRGGGGRGGFGGGGGGGNGIDLSKPIHVATYGEWTKKEGLSRIDPNEPGAKVVYFEDARYGITKASEADTYIFTRQSFTEYPNYWAFGPNFTSPYQLTDVNPQMKEFAWSSGTKLIDYKSAKGDKLQAALYLPANYEPGKKYPMLVTIYEKRSQNKNGFVTPSDTRAPDPTLYTNRGYIVMDPDIVYRVNDPGMSAVWCVIPAVKAAIASGMVDSANVGIWGHSWGGYQTAFLVTQTNIFKAAIAGAPLTNMVSMYASVYWNTGGSDASIFESSQGRFKGNFIDNWDAYYRNSPVNFANKVTTPLIILQNDKDGAVDFNQGVTYFNTLRQLGKQVIFLEYQGENHGLARPVNQRDYASRMGEWFDSQLKGQKPSDWIANGVPRIKMDEHLQSRKDSSSVRIIGPISQH